MTPRQTLIAGLERATGKKADELMNFLQDRALISDLAITISDVPETDLNRALRVIERAHE